MPVTAPLDALNAIGPSWGWAVFFAWFWYQLYWPYGETKLQQYHHDFTSRLERIEITQIAIAEEVRGVSAHEVKSVHEREDLSTSDLKERTPEPDD